MKKDEEFEKLLFIFGAEGIIALAQGLYRLSAYFRFRREEEEEVFRQLPEEFISKTKRFAKVVHCYKSPSTLKESIDLIKIIWYEEGRGCKRRKVTELDLLLPLLKLLEGR